MDAKVITGPQRKQGDYAILFTKEGRREVIFMGEADDRLEYLEYRPDKQHFLSWRFREKDARFNEAGNVIQVVNMIKVKDGDGNLTDAYLPKSVAHSIPFYNNIERERERPGVLGLKEKEYIDRARVLELKVNAEEKVA